MSLSEQELKQSFEGLQKFSYNNTRQVYRTKRIGTAAYHWANRHLSLHLHFEPAWV